jgi:two-component system sensor histidine kinase KdpD
MSDEPRERKRPSPDALLEQTRRETGTRGRLKIFLGAAPGVGKTYEMLTSARAKKREGVDVVVGVVETHGRAETLALLEGLEVIPRRKVDYKGSTLEEMDLDALLTRRPKIALVDELAHTNAPGSRHPKRYLDVEELLEAGVDVFTTLNIQHVESLNDVVAQITRIRVRETVPDSVLDRADDIEVIDLSPDDLMQRLREGKVYLPRQAERALQHYFSPGNLTALRELALRRTAQRVDAQLLSHMQAHAIAGPWAAGERVLVCVSEDPRAQGLVRYAKRLADRWRAPWTALVVESRRSLHLNEAQRDQLADTLRLADRLGAEVETRPSVGPRIADDIVAFAQDTNVTHIVIGKSVRSRWFELLHGSVVHDLVRRSGAMSVHVIAGEAFTGESEARPQTGRAPTKPNTAAYVATLLGVAASIGIGKAIEPIFGIESVGLVFLTSIVVVAFRFGLYASLSTVVMSTLAYNFFFLPPLYTLTIADPRNVAALFFFTVVALIVSNLASRSRMDALASQLRMRATEALYGFSRKLAGCGSLDDVLWATAFQVASMLKVRVVILLPEPGGIAVQAGYPPEDTIDSADIAAAKWAFDNNRPAGRGADTLPGAKRLFLPMRTGRGVIGVMGIDNDSQGPILTPEQQRLLDALVDQGALAIERVHLVEEIDKARLDAETDRLRQALLTSISHDLRTPLASVLGSAQVLRDLDGKIDPATRSDLIGTIIEEAERLNRFIANLLDMTRLESGAVTPKLVPHDLSDLVGTALQRASKILATHRVDTDLPATLPPVAVDAVLFEQVLFNLLDNAAKYTPEGSTIMLRAQQDGGVVRLDVRDQGPGIPPAELERIFDKFYRAQKGDRVRPGTGLGLAIARGLLEAMGGRLTAANRTEGSGAVFSLNIPAAVEREQGMDKVA